MKIIVKEYQFIFFKEKLDTKFDGNKKLTKHFYKE